MAFVDQFNNAKDRFTEEQLKTYKKKFFGESYESICLSVIEIEHIVFALDSGYQLAYIPDYNKLKGSKSKREPFLKEIAKSIKLYFDSNKPSENWCDFSNKLRYWRGMLINNLNMNVGRAQKTINMAFKYMYCFKDADGKKEYFKYCHMPLDRFILNWYNEWYSEVFGLEKHITTNWTDICSDIEYSEIQNNIHLYLCVANYKGPTISNEIHLDSNSLKSEFVIWPDRKQIGKDKKENKND